MLGMCPDIAYAVGTLSQYSANPGPDHLTVVNWVLKYLNSTKNFKLVYNGESCHDWFPQIRKGTWDKSDLAQPPGQALSHRVSNSDGG